MIDSRLYCLVMAGGQGTRFWPESTPKKPKQYLSLIGENSLLMESLKRFEGLVPANRRKIITTKNQLKLAKKYSQEMIEDDGIICEPSGRNTAPCILLALAHLIESGMRDEDVVAIVPSDHVILNTQGFASTMKLAFEHAVKDECIVTIGIPPHFPQTGFGYIQKGEAIGGDCFKVEAFKEKPDFETAKKYVASGDYYWNAGMFVGRLDTLLEQFKDHAADLFLNFQALRDSLKDEEELHRVYEKCEKISIDYAVMEKSPKILVIPAQFDWNDLGSWDAMESVVQSDKGNTVVKAQELYADGAQGNIVFAPDKFVALIDVENLVVVVNEEGVLVCNKKSSQKVKDVVPHLYSR